MNSIKKEDYIAKYKRCLKEYIDTSDRYLQTEDDMEGNDGQMPMGDTANNEQMPMGDNGANGEQMPMGDNGVNGEQMPMGDDGANGEQMPMGDDGATPPEGFSPQVGDDVASDEVNTDEGEDVEEIDVDELVDAQDNTNDKISKLMHKFSSAAEKMVKMVDNISTKIDATTERINNLEKEIEKRNPTPVEKMTLRSSQAYPFNVSPKDYWKEKEATSDYSIADDNNGADDEKYKITKSDIDGINDYYDISRKMSQPASLKDILDF